MEQIEGGDLSALLKKLVNHGKYKYEVSCVQNHSQPGSSRQKNESKTKPPESIMRVILLAYFALAVSGSPTRYEKPSAETSYVPEEEGYDQAETVGEEYAPSEYTTRRPKARPYVSAPIRIHFGEPELAREGYSEQKQYGPARGYKAPAQAYKEPEYASEYEVQPTPAKYAAPPKKIQPSPSYARTYAAPAYHEYGSETPEEVPVPEAPELSPVRTGDPSSGLVRAHIKAVKKLAASHEAAYASPKKGYAISRNGEATRNLALAHAAAVQKSIADNEAYAEEHSRGTYFSITSPERVPERAPRDRNYVPILRFDSEIQEGKLHSFSFDAANGIHQDETTTIEQAPGDSYEYGNNAVITKSGSVSYYSPEGQHIRLSYVGDKDGFRAKGAHLPTPPPGPEAIQQAMMMNQGD